MGYRRPSDLPEDLLKTLSTVRVQTNVEEYRLFFSPNKNNKKEQDIFSMMLEGTPEVAPKVSFEEVSATWATDTYTHLGDGYGPGDPINDVSVIVPRIEKTKAEQVSRTKKKAEVFTPAWICNLQNNLADDVVVGKNSFNIPSDDFKTWTATKSPVVFTTPGYNWMNYVVERRLEMCCGEAPYLVSPYDAVSGEVIPVRDDIGNFQRTGLLDRKLRVVTENMDLGNFPKNEWHIFAMAAFKNSYGFEWQGDNLILARLNLLNTYIDYYQDVFNVEPSHENLLEVAEVVSWNIWQMDGLKMTLPATCDTETCISCDKKKGKKSRTGHNGKLPVIRYMNGMNDFLVIPFEKTVQGNHS